MHIISRSILLAGAGIASLSMGIFGASNARASLNFTFDAASDYSANFRLVPGSVTPSVTSDALGNYLSVPFGAATVVYDTTPADSGVKNTFTVAKGTSLTVSVSWYSSTDLSSLGLYVIDPNNENNSSATSYLSLVNINSSVSGASAATERFRFWSDVANPIGQSIGTTASYDIAADAGITNGQWNTITWTYSLNTNGQAVVDTKINGVTEEATINSALSTFELGLRLSNRGSTYGIDTLTVAQSDVPEPASLGILGLGGLLMFRRRVQK